MLKFNTNQKGKIGLLLPRSAIFPHANQHLIEGLQIYLTLHCPGITEHNCEMLIEDTANAAINISRERAEKLLLSDRVQVLAGVMSFEVADALRPLLEKTGTPLLLLSTGAHSLADRLRSPLIHTISLQTWQSNYCLGKFAAEQYNAAAFFSSLYDSGFDHNNAFAAGFQQKDPESHKVFMTVSHIQSDHEDFGLVMKQAPVGEYEVLVGSYLQELALRFLQVSRPEPRLLSPLSLPWQLPGFRELPPMELHIAGTWPWHQTEALRDLDAQVQHFTSKPADHWHLLGYESGQLISELFTLAYLQKAATDTQLQHIRESQLSSPRGTLQYDSRYQHFTSEIARYHLRVEKGEITVLDRVLCAPPDPESPALKHLRNTEKSAWLQPYGF